MTLIDKEKLVFDIRDKGGFSSVFKALKEAPAVDAVPVEFIESEIKWMEEELTIMFDNDADDGEIDRMLAGKTALEVMLGRWKEEH